MSSNRLIIPESLLEHLNNLDAAGHQYKEQHLSDGGYGALEKDLRDTLDDRSIDFVDDFASTFALLRRYDREAKEYEEIKKTKKDEFKTYATLQKGMGETIRQPIARLVTEVGLFKKANNLSKDDQELCELTLKELEALNTHAETLMELKS